MVPELKVFLVVSVLLSGLAHAETSYVVEGDASGLLKIHVIEFSPEENVGFEVVDGGEGKKQFWVTNHFDKAQHLFITNGGYFDASLEPVGYCVINGKVLGAEPSARLSGYVTVDDAGALALHWKQLPEGNYKDVIQAGPYIIDPGGKLGIYSNNGRKARRTVLGQTADGGVLVMTTTEVTLFDLARVLKDKLPQIERALNLDGGPSVGLIYDDILIRNPSPVRNFIRKQKTGETVQTNELP